MMKNWKKGSAGQADMALALEDVIGAVPEN